MTERRPFAGGALASGVLLLSVALSACGGTGALDGGGGAPASGGTESGGGGAEASGGAGAGGASSGGAASGGAGTGGAGAGGASSGGASSGTGGVASVEGWEEVRCWHNAQLDRNSCYGRLGNLWATVAPDCALPQEDRGPMTLNAMVCSGVDDAGGWDETWCDDSSCYGRLGHWFTGLRTTCEFPEAYLVDETPGELFCDSPEEPTGWQDVECYVFDGQIIEVYCYGSRGIYWPMHGVYPICEVETHVSGPDWTEVTADPADCP